MIKQVQECDRCAKTRELKKDESPKLGGWRELDPNFHLCAECLAEIKKQKKENN